MWPTVSCYGYNNHSQPWILRGWDFWVILLNLPVIQRGLCSSVEKRILPVYVWELAVLIWPCDESRHGPSPSSTSASGQGQKCAWVSRGALLRDQTDRQQPDLQPITRGRGPFQRTICECSCKCLHSQKIQFVLHMTTVCWLAKRSKADEFPLLYHPPFMSVFSLSP